MGGGWGGGGGGGAVCQYKRRRVPGCVREGMRRCQRLDPHNETAFIYPNASRPAAVNQEAAGASLQRQALYC